MCLITPKSIFRLVTILIGLDNTSPSLPSCDIKLNTFLESTDYLRKNILHVQLETIQDYGDLFWESVPQQ